MLKLTIIQQNLHRTYFDCLSDKVFKYLNVLVLTLTLKMFTFNQLSINFITLYIVSFIGINILNVMYVNVHTDRNTEVSFLGAALLELSANSSSKTTFSSAANNHA